MNQKQLRAEFEKRIRAFFKLKTNSAKQIKAWNGIKDLARQHGTAKTVPSGETDSCFSLPGDSSAPMTSHTIIFAEPRPMVSQSYGIYYRCSNGIGGDTTVTYMSGAQDFDDPDCMMHLIETIKKEGHDVVEYEYPEVII